MKVCPSCKRDLDPTVQDICTNCGYQLSTQTSVRPSFTQTISRPKIQAEVMLAATNDRTGSSRAFAIGIPLMFAMLLQMLAAKLKVLRIFLNSHADLDCGEKMIAHVVNGTVDQAIAGMKKIRYEGGGDPSESHLDAIENLLTTIPWKLDSSHRGAILGFMTDDTKPARSGRSASQIGHAIRERGILLYLVCEPTPTLRELCDSAQGLMFEITNEPKAEELQQIAAQLAASVVATVASGGTIPMAGPVGR